MNKTDSVNTVLIYLQEETWDGSGLWETQCSKEQSWPRAVCCW